jgi:hypothetical protein
MITDVLLIAVWFGLVTDLLEGWGFLAFQQFGRLTHVRLEIVWISTSFDVFLFSLAGIALAA